MSKDATNAKQSTSTRSRTLFVALALVLVACLAAIALAASPRASEAYADDAAMTAQAVSAFPYDGSTVEFRAADGTSLGMFSNPAGDMQVTLANGTVRISFTPKNQTIFYGFYLNADKSDPSTWNDADFIAAQGPKGSWTYDFTLPDSYCGMATPIAPVKQEAGGRSGSDTTSEQYYLAIPSLTTLSVTVTFTNGLGHVISTQPVSIGSDATPPDPVSFAREDYDFAGWDAPYTNITQDTTINATWALPEGVKGYTVKFTDGLGNIISSQPVRENYPAVAPPDPWREGYRFTGWNPTSFDKITSDLTVDAQWLSEAEISLEAVHGDIAVLPDDHTSLLLDTDNVAVAKAGAAYLALSSDLQDQVSDADRLKLSHSAIAVLPSDAYKVTSAHKDAIERADAIVKTLPTALQSQLDADTCNSSRTFGRYLECATWALDSLKPINNVTLLANGTYTGKVTSTPSKGKNDSRRETWKTFSVKNVTVTGGKMYGTLETTSNSYQSLMIGGQEYENLQTDSSKGAYFEIPLALNSTFHFSVKGKNATDDTDAVPYELTVTADEAAMTPDALDLINGSGGGGAAASASSKSGSGSKGGGTNLNSLVSSGSGSSSKTSTPSDKNTATASSRTGGSQPAASAGLAEITMAGADGGGAGGFGLGPAIAGIALLFVSGGALAFTTRFVRRESTLL